MPGGSDGYRAAPAKRRLTPGRISSLPVTGGLPLSISFSISCPELESTGRGVIVWWMRRAMGADVAILESRASALSCSSDDGNRNEAGAYWGVEV